MLSDAIAPPTALTGPRQIDAHAAIDDAQVVGTWRQLHSAVPARADLLLALEDFHGDTGARRPADP